MDFTTGIRMLVVGLCEENAEDAATATRYLLQEKEEDSLIIILREAIVKEKLVAGSEIAITISEIIDEFRPRREMLARLSKQLKNPANRLDTNWADVTLATNTGISIEDWTKNWSRLRWVPANKQLYTELRAFSAP